MPIFEYRCGRCDERFEELVRGDERVSCPRCGAGETQKLLSGFAVAKAGGGSAAREAAPFAGGASPCGTCGDPRGPGSCSL